MKKRSLILYCSIVLILLLVYIFRYALVYQMQRRAMAGIKNKAIVSNTSFSRASLHHNHKLYSLQGTGRLLPHRVNSLDMLKQLYDDFEGFECDIRFDDHTARLVIDHDAIKPGDNILPDFLHFDKKGKLFWLDIKNLSMQNVHNFISRLNSLDTQFRIRNRVILESTSIEPLNLVAREGYFTSYEVPVMGPAAIGAHENKDQMNEVVSQDIAFYQQVRKNYAHKKMLTWDLSFSHSLSRETLLKNANDTNILLCLINIKSGYYK